MHTHHFVEKQTGGSDIFKHSHRQQSEITSIQHLILKDAFATNRKGKLLIVHSIYAFHNLTL